MSKETHASARVGGGPAVNSRSWAVRVVAVTFAILLTISAPASFLMISTSPVGTASAATNDFEDGFENESADAGIPENWQTDTYSDGTYNVTTKHARSGSQSAGLTVDGSAGSVIDMKPNTQPYSTAKTEDVGTWLYLPGKNLDGDDMDTVQLRIKEGGTRIGWTSLSYNHTSGEAKLEYFDGATRKTATTNVQRGQWIYLSFSDIDVSADTYTFKYDSSTASGEVTGVSLENAATDGYDETVVRVDDSAYVDDFKNTFSDQVSGTVTNGSGTEVEGATVELEDSSGTVTDEVKTDATGYYEFLGVSHGTDYTVRAGGAGYAHNETAPFDVSADVTGKNLTLDTPSLQGKVKTTEGASCSGCTVELWLMNDQNTTTDAGETVEEAQKDSLETVSRAVPRDTFTQEIDLLNANKFTGDGAGKQVLVHSQDAWYEESDPIGPYQPSVGSAGTRDLQTPLLQLEPDTPYTFSVWDRSRDPTPEDGVDSKVEPGVSSSGTVVIEQIGPGNSTIDRIELETEPKVRTGFGFVAKKHEYAEKSLPIGYYRVYPQNGGAAYTIRVGQPEDVSRTIHSDLETVDNQTASISQEVQDKIDSGAMKRVTVETDAQGNFSYKVPDGYSTVAITVFDGKGLTDGITDPTLSDLRTQIQQQDYKGSIYMSSSPEVVNPPATDVQVTVVELTNPTLGDLSAYLDQLAWLEDLVNKESFAELDHLFTDPLNQESELLDARNRLRDTVLGNSQLRSTFEEIASERGAPTDLYRDDLSKSELQAQVDALQATLTQDQSSLDGQPGPGTGSSTPTYDTSPNPNGGTTINVEIPTGSDLNESDDSQSVVCQQPDGSTRWINSSNVSIDSGVAPGDTVLVEDVVGNQTAGCNYIVMAPGEDEGVVREEVNVENPAFSGTIPQLSSINVNTMRPGPSEEVIVGVKPTETSSFTSVQGATVYGPDGSQLTTSLKNGKVHFTTNGAGSHLVKINVSDGDRSYVESMRLKAGNSSVKYPASVRVHNGVLGRSVVASDGVESGRISVEEGGSVARITAEVDGENVPNTIHVHARDLTGLQQKLDVAVVKASDGSRVTKGSQIKLHMARLNEDSYVRVNGNPVTTDATKWGKVEHFSDSTLITTNLRDGTVEVSANNNPGWIDTAGWYLDLALAEVPSLSIVPVGLVEPVATIVLDVQLGAPIAQLVATADGDLLEPTLELVGDAALEAPDPATLGVPLEVIA